MSRRLSRYLHCIPPKITEPCFEQLFTMKLVRVLCFRSPTNKIINIYSLVNIHTHLWGATLFGFFLTDFYRHMNQYSTTNFLDVAGFVIFLVSAVICLSFSASYHIFSCHSKKAGFYNISHSPLFKLLKFKFASSDTRYFS